jgi:hypothetical protein
MEHTFWELEFIPDTDKVYCFVHSLANVNPKTGKPRAAAFHNTPKQGDNLSCDWEKYSTPQETKARIGQQFKTGTTEFKNPNLFAIVEFTTGVLRTEEYNQQIEHDPILNNPEIVGIPNNQAHSIIIGEKDEETRLKMVELAQWVIPPSV